MILTLQRYVSVAKHSATAPTSQGRSQGVLLHNRGVCEEYYQGVVCAKSTQVPQLPSPNIGGGSSQQLPRLASSLVQTGLCSSLRWTAMAL